MESPGSNTRSRLNLIHHLPSYGDREEEKEANLEVPGVIFRERLDSGNYNHTSKSRHILLHNKQNDPENTGMTSGSEFPIMQPLAKDNKIFVQGIE